ncbi:ribonuclease E activity regulator RraA [Lysobacter auxotrophicus]|uniref:4-hydroxy-4-methyl-2-oxoglutarate aldolase n=1 Tax=Lysobacter auxotrophicus TaxID=2992573 RepID=A0ABM8DA52_9GAMM|nr:ribonuclease E activity regulator RraA [Lysobacter auxotrophicus]BDU15436.1 ribonuclease E activity regulator RraA [Lysobacter auxotrophicus]
MKTCDLCDLHDAQVRVLELPLQDFGGRIAFNGMVSTVRAIEDNSRVREAVEEPGQGRVLVIDGGGSMRRAMIGDLLAAKAAENGWAGVLVFGAIRDSDAIATIALGVKALGTCPRKTDKLGAGERDVEVEFGGVRIRPGDWLCADEDGVVLADTDLR